VLTINNYKITFFSNIQIVPFISIRNSEEFLWKNIIPKVANPIKLCSFQLPQDGSSSTFRMCDVLFLGVTYHDCDHVGPQVTGHTCFYCLKEFLYNTLKCNIVAPTPSRDGLWTLGSAHNFLFFLAHKTLTPQNFDYDEVTFKLGTCLFRNPRHATHNI
jgi:hypothetical protein